MKKPLLAIFIIVFIDLVGFGMVIPILPYYAKSFGASATTLGWLMMCYSGMQFLFSPYWGSLSDKIGRRPVLLTCILGIGASMILLGWAPTLPWLFAARLLAGFFGANISTASAYIADVTKPEDRAKGMGMIGAAFGMGFLFGPALGGVLSKWGYGTAGYVAGGMAILNFILAFKVLKEPALTAEIRATHRNRPRLATIRETLSHSKTGSAILLFFIVTLGVAQLETTFALFLLTRFQINALHAGFILALMAVVMVLIQGGAIGRLAKRFGEGNLVVAGSLIMSLALIGASRAPLISGFVWFVVLHALGYGITNPSLLAITSKNSPASAQGAVMGVYQSAGSLARVLGPLAAGFLFDRIGITAPFLVASLLFSISFLVTLMARKKWKTSNI